MCISRLGHVVACDSSSGGATVFRRALLQGSALSATTTTTAAAASSTTKWLIAASAVDLLIMRGGEVFAPPTSGTTALDIGRVRMRLEGLQSYGTLAALLANGCLRLYSCVNEKDAADCRYKAVAFNLFLLAVVISILSGAYTTVVFTLLPLYCKTALGRGYDAQFLQFWAATAALRETGLEAFLVSLISFEIAFCLSLFVRLAAGSRRQVVLVALAAVLCAASVWEWTAVMRLAAQYLFPIRAEVEY